ncbi:MAG: hypothetical protein KME15_19865 [Drouetiella hepatica Uher 2000/2452]|jgi:hypothetical protein|uniref:Uncharacterized protein n=1 Tax=Drouetiella hepatica Uher 2000/2452 TaxID=904376 RepID=A0A951UQY8_9CYAN|nr:hypothetical protein [Drouetiella hepatica Uher 2000/2452]
MTNKFYTFDFVSKAKRLVAAIAASTGATDASKIISTNSAGVLDVSFLPPGVDIQVETINTSEALAAGDFINIYDAAGTRTCRKADASNSRMAHGYVLAAVSSGQPATVYKTGKNSGLSGRTLGTPYFLSAVTAGTSTASPSAYPTAQILQVLGYADSTTSILFEFDQPDYLDA